MRYGNQSKFISNIRIIGMMGYFKIILKLLNKFSGLNDEIGSSTEFVIFSSY